jgi:C4-dicarboxylate-specific signal transduction histidine kinase
VYFIAHLGTIVRFEHNAGRSIIRCGDNPGNAIQAMSGSLDRPRRLLVSTSVESSLGIVTVNDTSLGIGSKVRTASLRRLGPPRPMGMGLGLSICISIVSRHGGRISASANDGAGASFAFSIPLDEDV